jgi:phosphoribosylanthranilate isomerase
VTYIKFCGMTQAKDVQHALSLGVRYVGCVFAGGPRQQTLPEAVAVFDGITSHRPGRVGVFASADAQVLRAPAKTLNLDAVQLHGDAGVAAVDTIRGELGIEVWGVVRCTPGEGLPARATELWLTADAVLLDTRVAGRLGGTGVPLTWSNLVEGVDLLRKQSRRSRLVVAGGLTAENVGSAIALLRPDVVDVSSGIEYTPGKKDHARMEAFVQAVAAADQFLAESGQK